MSDVSVSSVKNFPNIFKSFFELMKPRVMSLVIFTALVGIVLRLLSLILSLLQFPYFLLLWERERPEL